jgi:ribosomal protein S18 acetylase RimI-like enzyme
MTQMLIRDARLGDEDDLQRLTWLLWDHHCGRRPARFRTADEITSSKPPPPPPFQLAERTCIAEASHRVAGYIRAVLRNVPQSLAYRPQRVAIITELAVLPEFREHGIGRTLVRTIQDWARENGAETIEVPVFGFNEEAISLYTAAGFAPWLLQLRCDVDLEERNP